jgi:hypothetical protein
MGKSGSMDVICGYFFFLGSSLVVYSARPVLSHPDCRLSSICDICDICEPDLGSRGAMASDEIVWQVINQQFCSYKLK